MQIAPTMHGVAGQLPGGRSLCELPVVPVLSSPQPTTITHALATTPAISARTTDILSRHAVPCPPLVPRARSDAWAAARRAMGTRKGLQLT